MSAISFSVEQRIPGALGRAGRLVTPNGTIETPAFVAVGTRATVKSLTPEQIHLIGAQVVLANTYHLYLEPGSEIVREAGGLGAFMNWDGPTITDSGGFQVFSLGAGKDSPTKFIRRDERDAYKQAPTADHGRLVTIDSDGVTFRSHIDGSEHRFTPERSIAIQHDIGADIMFAFDECTSPTADKAYQREAMERTHAWAARSLAYHAKEGDPSRQALFGIVQGGSFRDLREESARTIGAMDFPGFGIGGSYTKEELSDVLVWVHRLLPEEKPRHLLGIGEPADLFLGIEHGVDTFDCVSPTRIARSGMLYTPHGKISLSNAKYRKNMNRITDDERDPLYPYTYAYLAHLFRTNEILGIVLASMHNLYFIAGLVQRIRASILDGTFESFRDDFLTRYGNA